jgi:hypothetical protein
MYKKTSELEMVASFKEGASLLPPLVIVSWQTDGVGRADARMQVRWADERETFTFVLEAKAQSTPQAVMSAVAEARASSGPNEHPMVLVPYLSPERLADLERERMSGIDLCGNGLVLVPGRLYVLRTGQPNAYPDSRPLNNPYRGRSAMVARQLLAQPRHNSLGELRSAIQESGVKLSLSQVSKAVTAMQEDLILSKGRGAITLQEPQRLLDSLGRAWRGYSAKVRRAIRIPQGLDWAGALLSVPQLKWAITGESSARRYAAFSQGGARQLAVSNLQLAQMALGGQPEEIPSFADLELVETDEAGLFFANEVDEKGLRWASRLQTWLELQAGDGRQRETAREIGAQILREVKP